MIQMEPLKCVAPLLPLEPGPYEQWRNVAVSPALKSAQLMRRPELYAAFVLLNCQYVCWVLSNEKQPLPDELNAGSKSGDKLHSSPEVPTVPPAWKAVSQVEMPRMYICIRSPAPSMHSRRITVLVVRAMLFMPIP